MIRGPLFLTGGSGFIGCRLMRLLAESTGLDVRILSRTPTQRSFHHRDQWPPGWRLVAGDLTEPGGWVAGLAGVDTVVHLAAHTGKASRAEYFAANRDATGTLLEVARAAGVRRFLFVSSIAAGFKDRRHYHYANAKAEAETLVQRSGLQVLIVRPTLVLGPGSPALANLARLATLPVPITFGRGRAVQPIHVDDLAETVRAALELPLWRGEIVELGGPMTLPMDELVTRIRAKAGLRARRVRRIPARPLRALLAALEPVLLPALPFTAGQLAAFANPSVAAARPASVDLPLPRRGLDAMLEGSPGDG